MAALDAHLAKYLIPAGGHEDAVDNARNRPDGRQFRSAEAPDFTAAHPAAQSAGRAIARIGGGD
jgi:hypothetical protein